MSATLAMRPLAVKTCLMRLGHLRDEPLTYLLGMHRRTVLVVQDARTIQVGFRLDVTLEARVGSREPVTLLRLLRFENFPRKHTAYPRVNDIRFLGGAAQRRFSMALYVHLVKMTQ